MLLLSEDLDANKIHVQAPSEIVFLCGGPFSYLESPVPLSLRDAFLKIVDYPPLREKDLIQAEDITSEYSFFEFYDNILDFETDLAQIVELIILFCESEGSLAELGAFAMIDEIAERLFLIVRQKHWQELSFIKLGPLRRVERKYGRDAIYVVEDEDVGLHSGNAADIDKNALGLLLKDPLFVRFQKPRDPTTFDKTRSGHVIKLIVGLVQEYGALNLNEIEKLLVLLGATKTSKQIEAYLLCAKAVGWLQKLSKGSVDYYVAKKTKVDAATILLKRQAKVKNKARRRLLIRDYWRANDALRYRSIIQVFGGEDG